MPTTSRCRTWISPASCKTWPMTWLAARWRLPIGTSSLPALSQTSSSAPATTSASMAAAAATWCCTRPRQTRTALTPSTQAVPSTCTRTLPAGICRTCAAGWSWSRTLTAPVTGCGRASFSCWSATPPASTRKSRRYPPRHGASRQGPVGLMEGGR